MDVQMFDDQLEPIYNSSVSIQDVDKTTSRKRWTIETGGERGSWKSVLTAQHDDDGTLKVDTSLNLELFLNNDDDVLYLITLK